MRWHSGRWRKASLFSVTPRGPHPYWRLVPPTTWNRFAPRSAALPTAAVTLQATEFFKGGTMIKRENHLNIKVIHGETWPKKKNI